MYYFTVAANLEYILVSVLVHVANKPCMYYFPRWFYDHICIWWLEV